MAKTTGDTAVEHILGECPACGEKVGIRWIYEVTTNLPNRSRAKGINLNISKAPELDHELKGVVFGHACEALQQTPVQQEEVTSDDANG